MKILKGMLVSTVAITAFTGLGKTSNLVSAASNNSVVQQEKSNVEKREGKQIIVKFKNEINLPYEDGIEKRIKHEKNDVVLESFFSEFPDLTLTRLFTSVSPEEIQNLDKNAKTDNNNSSANLLNYYTVQVSKNVPAKRLVEKLKQSPLIENVYIQELEDLTPPEIQLPNLSLNPYDDPRFENQGYLKEAPYGINAPYAWGIKGGDGKGTTLVDMESGWVLDHEDLIHQNIEFMSGINVRERSAHGTGVLGIVAAEDNQIGNIGIVPKATVKVISQFREHDYVNRADAILSAVNTLHAGDVLLLELQSTYAGYGDQYLPAEVQPAVFDAIRTGTDKGIIIIEAGANGSNDLDQFKDINGKQVLNRNSKDFKDSGAIIVGAGSSTVPHERLYFSNYGSRIDVYGWGEDVDTTSSDPNRSAKNLYTSSFNGTSSASPIIAGAATSIQSIAKEHLGQPYKPNELRAILSNKNTGTQSNNPSSDRIGVLPDLKAILSNLGFKSNGSDSESKPEPKPEHPQTGQITEQEPNNQSMQANILDVNATIKGNLNDNDNVDVYTFNVSSQRNIDISLLNENEIGMTWTLHHESDLQNYVAYGQNDGNMIKGKYEAKPGKYYLHVYKYENKNGSYVLNVK
ncbi:S8 family peptidase [Bacillus pseudomycoides]|uniref:S8 family peptidase n=3 Tax=Bacillus pseudomycoides TaxID=64104 RepID=UPI000BEC2C30|nr:S8 family serine peptidase [Bacillus pseudomycoides]PED06130.1 peptidase [Bacillus pseudomycoides]PEI95573.1 peptidase [Bacillus pseudomycoides]PEK29993.1 peptidase [Bacillus pseudomycoides]PEM70424.1 peptidase [Bacillus pseudomycoides]PEO07949.1 peptidase [Bacillus pseudomycoides]